MIDIYETFMKHIINMAVNGYDAPVHLFDNANKQWKSIYADGTVLYKIYTAYEDYENEYLNTTLYQDNPNLIPALIISTPELYYKGLIPYKGQLLSLRSVLENVDTTSNLPKINLFIIPIVKTSGDQFLGRGTLDIMLDYNTYWDIYGLQGKDLAEVINYRYYQVRPGQYFSLSDYSYINGRSYTIYFVPKESNVLYDRSILNRIYHRYTIRYTSVVKGSCKTI